MVVNVETALRRRLATVATDKLKPRQAGGFRRRTVTVTQDDLRGAHHSITYAGTEPLITQVF
jgi:hypothetical protein